MSIEDGSRREALRILGAIGGTCAFPFSANELYGQQEPVTPAQQVHQHAGPPQRPAALKGPAKPGYFAPADFEIISRIADLIIPPTDTPGAVEAGVPSYIDSVVGGNSELQTVCRAGIALLQGRQFMTLTATAQIELLTPWSAAVDSGRQQNDGERFFRLIKNLTADGYYTSYVGLIEELKYSGNTALDHFPVSTIPEH